MSTKELKTTSVQVQSRRRPRKLLALGSITGATCRWADPLVDVFLLCAQCKRRSSSHTRPGILRTRRSSRRGGTLATGPCTFRSKWECSLDSPAIIANIRLEMHQSRSAAQPTAAGLDLATGLCRRGLLVVRCDVTTLEAPCQECQRTQANLSLYGCVAMLMRLVDPTRYVLTNWGRSPH